MKSTVYCRYCLKDISNMPRYKHGDFCNVSCHGLSQHSETHKPYPYPKEREYPIPSVLTSQQPFVGDSDHADIQTDRGGQRIIPDMGVRRSHESL